MRIIEGKGPPSPDTFGTSNHLYKDTSTGAFYRCHGNINEQRTLPYGPAHKHPGEQYWWTPIPHETKEVISEPLNITWEGDTAGLVCVAEMMYKVSDAVLTDEQIKTATITTSDGSSFPAAGMWDDMVAMGAVTEDCMICEVVAFVRKAGAEFNGMVFPETGIYFISSGDMYVSALTTTAPVEYTKTVVKKLDEKFLPELPIVVTVTITDAATMNGKANYTSNDVLAFMAANKPVICTFNGLIAVLTGIIGKSSVDPMNNTVEFAVLGNVNNFVFDLNADGSITLKM